MASVSFPQKLMNWAGSKAKLEQMTPAQIKQAASELGVTSSKVLTAITKLQDTGYAGVVVGNSNKLDGNLASGASTPVPQKDVHAAAEVAGPPKTLADATTRIADKLGGAADVSSERRGGDDRVLVRFEAKDKAAVEQGLKDLGVRKYNTGMRDAYSFGRFEIAVSPYATATMA